MSKKPLIMIIAGEISGDMHAGELVRAIKKKLPEAEFFGIGGDKLRGQGVDVLFGTDEMAVTGFTEVMRRYGFFRKVFNRMTSLAKERKPDAVILVDYPGFNLRFARVAHSLGIKVIYYICPQVWAWNRSRIPAMAKVIDSLITIFPFEKEHFKETGLKVDFAGHPLVNEAQSALEEPLKELPWNGMPRVALLPGSRSNEISRNLPVMWQAAAKIEEKHSEASFIIPVPNDQIEKLIRSSINELRDGPTHVQIVNNQVQQILRQANAAIVTSGTATIDTALMGCPSIIMYKMSAMTYLLGRMLVKLDHIGMVNIVAGKEICPEFIQNAATARNLADAIDPLLGNGYKRAKMVDELKKVSIALGEGNAAENAAQIVIDNLKDS